jgi:hypothetical protein
MAVAGAQVTPSGLSARIGLFLPTATEARDISSSWINFGVDYKLSTLSLKIPGVDMQSYFSISADYYTHSGDNDLPVALNYNLRQGSIVYSAGIGPEFRNAGDLTSTGTGLGEQIGVAFDLGTGPLPIFIQGKYYFSSKPELSGFGLYVGVRF